MCDSRKTLTHQRLSAALMHLGQEGHVTRGQLEIDADTSRSTVDRWWQGQLVPDASDLNRIASNASAPVVSAIFGVILQGSPYGLSVRDAQPAKDAGDAMDRILDVTRSLVDLAGEHNQAVVDRFITHSEAASIHQKLDQIQRKLEDYRAYIARHSARPMKLA